MRVTIESETLGRPSAKRSPFHSAVRKTICSREMVWAWADDSIHASPVNASTEIKRFIGFSQRGAQYSSTEYFVSVPLPRKSYVLLCPAEPQTLSATA